jgi:hypothetical protein
MTSKTTIKGQTETTTENRTDLRALEDAELDVVTGGTMAYVPHIYAIGRIEARFPH